MVKKTPERPLIDRVLELDSQALVKIMRDAGWSITKMTVSTGINGSTFSKAVNGKRQLGEESWRKLARLVIDEGLIK